MHLFFFTFLIHVSWKNKTNAREEWGPSHRAGCLVAPVYKWSGDGSYCGIAWILRISEAGKCQSDKDKLQGKGSSLGSGDGQALTGNLRSDEGEGTATGREIYPVYKMMRADLSFLRQSWKKKEVSCSFSTKGHGD